MADREDLGDRPAQRYPGPCLCTCIAAAVSGSMSQSRPRSAGCRSGVTAGQRGTHGGPPIQAAGDQEDPGGWPGWCSSALLNSQVSSAKGHSSAFSTISSTSRDALGIRSGGGWMLLAGRTIRHPPDRACAATACARCDFRPWSQRAANLSGRSSHSWSCFWPGCGPADSARRASRRAGGRVPDPREHAGKRPQHRDSCSRPLRHDDEVTLQAYFRHFRVKHVGLWPKPPRGR